MLAPSEAAVLIIVNCLLEDTVSDCLTMTMPLSLIEVGLVGLGVVRVQSFGLCTPVIRC
jgi:hypothetical protein